MGRIGTVGPALLLLSSFALASDPPSLRVLSYSGQVTVKTPDGEQTLAPDRPAPRLPSGSEVSIVSGRALLRAGPASIRMKAGDSVSFSVLPDGSSQITAGASRGSVLVRVAGGATAALKPGASVVIGAGTDGRPLISAPKAEGVSLSQPSSAAPPARALEKLPDVVTVSPSAP